MPSDPIETRKMTVLCQDCGESFSARLFKLPEKCAWCESTNLTEVNSPASPATPQESADADNIVKKATSKVQRNKVRPLNPPQVNGGTKKQEVQEAGKVEAREPDEPVSMPLVEPESSRPAEQPAAQPEAPEQGGGQMQEPIQNVQTNAQSVASSLLKKSDATRPIVEWSEKNPELVDFFKTVAGQIAGAMEKHSQRKAEIEREKLRVMQQQQVQAQQQQAPQQQQVTPFEQLPLEERVAWLNKGGRRKYYEAVGGGQGGPPPAPAYQQPYRPPAPAYDPPPQAAPQPQQPVKTENFTSLEEARRGMFGDQPPQQQAAQPPQQRPPQPMEQASPQPEPEATIEDVPDSEADSQTDVPEELQELPEEQREAYLMADQIIKEEQLQKIVGFVENIPTEKVRLWAEENQGIVDLTVADIKPFLSEEHREHPVVDSIAHFKVRDLSQLLSPQNRSLYASMNVETLTRVLQEKLPDRAELMEDNVVDWVKRNLQEIKEALQQAQQQAG